MPNVYREPGYWPWTQEVSHSLRLLVSHGLKEPITADSADPCSSPPDVSDEEGGERFHVYGPVRTVDGLVSEEANATIGYMVICFKSKSLYRYHA